ncbi:hypothetical protein [Paenibacillus sp. FSL W7-1332]|uniref:hypothetical protein n=1 Tax=Paenibacillus sp. FSL W7-1332 TaxID=2921702 RepID=UPI0030D502EA
MQIVVYAIRTSEKWECHLSLDMQVDLQWWYGVKRSTDEKESACSLVLLSTQVPLGWAVVIQERFRSIQDMDQWGKSDWQKYLYQSLSWFLLHEPEGSRSQWSVLFKEIQMLDGSYVNYSIKKRNVVEDWTLLMQQAELLIQCMVGRALLAGEVEALLAEVSGDTGDWRSAAQLGILLGRLRLEAGLAQPAPQGAPGWLRRRATAPAAGDAAARPEAARHAPRAARRLAPIARPASRWGAAAPVPCCCMAQQGSAVRGTAGGSPPWPWAGGGLAQRRAPPLALRCDFWRSRPQGAPRGLPGFSSGR